MPNAHPPSLYYTVLSPLELCHPLNPLLARLHSTENPIYVFPEMKLQGFVPNSYIHVSVRDLYILRIGLPIRLQQNGQIDSGNIQYSINRSQIHECGNSKTEHYKSVLEITRPPSFISGNT